MAGQGQSVLVRAALFDGSSLPFLALQKGRSEGCTGMLSIPSLWQRIGLSAARRRSLNIFKLLVAVSLVLKGLRKARGSVQCAPCRLVLLAMSAFGEDSIKDGWGEGTAAGATKGGIWEKELRSLLSFPFTSNNG